MNSKSKWKRKVPLNDDLSRAYCQYKEIERKERLSRRKYYNTRP